MTVKLLTKQHLEFLSLKGGFTGSSESIHVKMPHCWKSHMATHLFKVLRSESQMTDCQILSPVFTLEKTGSSGILNGKKQTPILNKDHNFGPSPPLLPYIVYVRNNHSRKTVRAHKSRFE